VVLRIGLNFTCFGATSGELLASVREIGAAGAVHKYVYEYAIAITIEIYAAS
jgi:hypothetical protein